MKLDTDSLAHTKWNCKYHIVFAPKYRRQVIYGKIKADIGIMLRKLCEYKQVEIIEAEAFKILSNYLKRHIDILCTVFLDYFIHTRIANNKGKLYFGLVTFLWTALCGRCCYFNSNILSINFRYFTRKTIFTLNCLADVRIIN